MKRLIHIWHVIRIYASTRNIPHLDVLLHDWDKVLHLPVNHKAISKHHIGCKSIQTTRDYLHMLCDWEACKHKPGSQLTTREYYSQVGKAKLLSLGDINGINTIEHLLSEYKHIWG